MKKTEIGLVFFFFIYSKKKSLFLCIFENILEILKKKRTKPFFGIPSESLSRLNKFIVYKISKGKVSRSALNDPKILYLLKIVVSSPLSPLHIPCNFFSSTMSWIISLTCLKTNSTTKPHLFCKNICDAVD